MTFELNRAILDYASRNRETLLFNIWQMGENSIKRGSQDNWTITPKRIDALRAAMPAGRGGRGGGFAGGDAPPTAMQHLPQQVVAEVAEVDKARPWSCTTRFSTIPH